MSSVGSQNRLRQLPKMETQFVRFLVVGGVHNVLAYVSYLGLTAWFMSPPAAVTVVYVAGLILSFFVNKSWSFDHDGHHLPAAARFIMLYIFGYALNLVALYVLVVQLHYPHVWAQGALTLALGLVFFFAQRWWVFR